MAAESAAARAVETVAAKVVRMAEVPEVGMAVAIAEAVWAAVMVAADWGYKRPA